MKKELTTLRLWNPLFPHIYPRNEWGDLENNPVDLSAGEILEYEDKILDLIEREKMMNKVTHKANMLAMKARMALANPRGEGFVDTAIKILMAVVIGALVLAGLYLLFDKTVLPTLTQRIKDMFNYAG
jgi:hypothetical protein